MVHILISKSFSYYSIISTFLKEYSLILYFISFEILQNHLECRFFIFVVLISSSLLCPPSSEFDICHPAPGCSSKSGVILVVYVFHSAKILGIPFPVWHGFVFLVLELSVCCLVTLVRSSEQWS